MLAGQAAAWSKTYLTSRVRIPKYEEYFGAIKKMLGDLEFVLNTLGKLQELRMTNGLEEYSRHFSTFSEITS
jgi:hypothetical protein